MPLIGVDAWEHAFYLQYQNVKADYFKAIWDVINFKGCRGASQEGPVIPSLSPPFSQTVTVKSTPFSNIQVCSDVLERHCASISLAVGRPLHAERKRHHRSLLPPLIRILNIPYALSMPLQL